MSFDWTSLFTSPALVRTLLTNWAIWLVLLGGPLVWKLLKGQPVTRHAWLRAAWSVVAIGCVVAFGNAAFDAGKQGLMSIPACILLLAGVFAAYAGSTHLLDRWYPEERP